MAGRYRALVQGAPYALGVFVASEPSSIVYARTCCCLGVFFYIRLSVYEGYIQWPQVLKVREQLVIALFGARIIVRRRAV